MSVKRILALLVAVLLTLSFFTGCGSNSKQEEAVDTKPAATTEAQTKETVEEKVEKLPEAKLLMYMVGEEGVDHKLILDEINKKLQAAINTTLEMKIIPTADVNARYPLIFASGEDFDMVFAAGWTGYKPQAEKGGYLELTDEMLGKYMPLTVANMEPIKWKPVMVKDKKYMIPRTDYVFNPLAIGIRGDLREKYSLPEIKSLADYELFLDTIAKNEKNIIPYGDNNNPNCWILSNLMLNTPNGWSAIKSSSSDIMFYKNADLTGEQIFVREETPEYLEWIKKMVEWRKKGYWSNSALTAKGTLTEQFEAGKSASYLHHTLAGSVGLYNKLLKDHPEWKLEIYDGTFGQKLDATIPVAGFALSANTKNPERSLMVLELFKNDVELYDLSQGGILGTHYELTPEGYTIPGPNAPNYGNISYYGLKTGQLNRLPGKTFPGYDAIVKSCKAREYFNPTTMFSLAVGDGIKNEFAAIKNIFDQTRPILNLGFNDDPEKTLKTYLEKMYAAGYEKVMADERQQLKAFLEGFNK